MEIVSRKSKAASTAERWARQYGINDGISTSALGSMYEKYNRLVDLGHSPDPDDVDNVLGNKSWTRLDCDECGWAVDVAMQLGNDDVDGVFICYRCLEKAVTLARLDATHV